MGTRWRTLEAAGGTRVVRCECGLVFVTPQPPRQRIRQTYGREYYEAWKAQARRRDRMWRGRIRRVERYAGAPGPLRPGRLLDVGCGTGSFLEIARERGWTVTGTEFSAEGVRAAKEAGLEVAPGELWEAAFPDAAFDVVTCWHVIEHVTDPRRLLGEIHRVLRPGGWLILATPNLDDRIFRAAYRLARRRRLRLYEPDERELHLFFFSGSTLRRLAASAGFEVIQIGFDRGAAVAWGKQVVEAIALAWYRLTRFHWGMGLELLARKPAPAPVPAPAS